jgi:hypothetical protein
MLTKWNPFEGNGAEKVGRQQSNNDFGRNVLQGLTDEVTKRKLVVLRK